MDTREKAIIKRTFRRTKGTWAELPIREVIKIFKGLKMEGVAGGKKREHRKKAV